MTTEDWIKRRVNALKNQGLASPAARLVARRESQLEEFRKSPGNFPIGGPPRA